MPAAKLNQNLLMSKNIFQPNNMKKIYFGCSIAGGRDHAHLYGDLVESIKAARAQVLSELFADKILKPGVGMNLDPNFVWQRDINWVQEADGLIMEVTQPSLGVGYEIAKAEEWGKPILALFYSPSGLRLSPMINGSPSVTVFEYKNLSEAQSVITSFINKI